jgi:hypothetical protein
MLTGNSIVSPHLAELDSVMSILDDNSIFVIDKATQTART